MGEQIYHLQSSVVGANIDAEIAGRVNRRQPLTGLGVVGAVPRQDMCEEPAGGYPVGDRQTVNIGTQGFDIERADAAQREREQVRHARFSVASADSIAARFLLKRLPCPPGFLWGSLGFAITAFLLYFYVSFGPRVERFLALGDLLRYLHSII